MTLAIRTEYRGIKFRSRVEADMAYLLDFLAIQWQYEPKSFLMENGTHYRPDFYFPEYGMYLECRGYESKKGREQIKEFSDGILKGIYNERYFNTQTIYGVVSYKSLFFDGQGEQEGIYIHICNNCSHVYLAGFTSICGKCGISDGNDYGLYISRGGYLSVSTGFQMDFREDAYHDMRVQDWIAVRKLDTRFSLVSLKDEGAI